jgi:hypothetical protein
LAEVRLLATGFSTAAAFHEDDSFWLPSQWQFPIVLQSVLIATLHPGERGEWRSRRVGITSPIEVFTTSRSRSAKQFPCDDDSHREKTDRRLLLHSAIEIGEVAKPADKGEEQRCEHQQADTLKRQAEVVKKLLVVFEHGSIPG